METSSTLDRLNAQVGALIDALKTSREEVARLNDELNACRAITRQREDSVNSLEESLGLKDMELEDMAERIEEALSGGSEPAQSAASSDAPAVQESVKTEEAVV